MRCRRYTRCRRRWRSPTSHPTWRRWRTDGWPDATRCCCPPATAAPGHFILAVAIAGALGFDVVVARFQQSAHDRRPFVHRAHAHGVPWCRCCCRGRCPEHGDVHHGPLIVEVDGAVIQHADHLAVVIDGGATAAAVVLRGHRVGGVLHHKLVVTAQDALRVFRGEHPAVFAGAVGQMVVILRIGTAIIHTQLRGAARVQFQPGQAHVEGIVNGRALFPFVIQ